MPLLKSWVTSANDANHPFPLNNLPCGVFSTQGTQERCGVAIGDMILDLAAAEETGLVRVADMPVFDVAYWNEFMELGADTWGRLRTRLIDLLAEGSADQAAVAPLLTGSSLRSMPSATAAVATTSMALSHAYRLTSATEFSRLQRSEMLSSHN